MEESHDQKEEINRTWEVNLAIPDDEFNGPDAGKILAEKVKRIVDDFHRRYEVQPSGRHMDARLTIAVARAKERPLLGPEGQVIREGDPGVEPWKGTQ